MTARHRARVLRGGRPRARRRERRVLPRRVRERGARVLRAARASAARARATSSSPTGETGPGGRIPFNTDGGLIARGHPGGPTGLAMVHECVQQLRGEADGRQVDGRARRARAPRGRRQRLHREPARRHRLKGCDHGDQRRPPRGRQGDPGPAVAGDPHRADGAVPGGQAGARLLRLRAADRVRDDLVASRAPDARPVDDHRRHAGGARPPRGAAGPPGGRAERRR